MNNILYFVLGVLVGWLIEWVIDYLYWRRRGTEQPAVRSQTLPAQDRSIRAAPDEKSSTRIAPDDLKIIKGIGAVIEGRLNQAGVYTFEQLASLTSIELRQILGNVIQRLADEDALLQQARELARAKKLVKE